MADTKANTYPKIAIVAGEASGDLHGARVAEALRCLYPDVFLFGAGGAAMTAAGVELAVHSDDLSVMGFSAVITKLPAIFKAMGRLKRLLRAYRPELVILIDFPDFNLRLASTAKKLGIPVLYYISPTVWAWRAGRLKKIKARVDHMAVILPFETEIYRQHHIPVTFVGHPLLDAMAPASVTPRQWPTEGPFRLALLPGSRPGEVRRLLPEMIKAALRVQQDSGPLEVIVSCAPSIPLQMIGSIVSEYPLKDLTLSEDAVDTIFNRCHLAIVASGTASLEAALAGIPMIIVYATSAVNYFLGKLLIKVPYIGLANLIAGRQIVPELVQEASSADNIARNILEIVKDRRQYQKMSDDLLQVQRMMGTPGAAEKVAQISQDLINSH